MSFQIDSFYCENNLRSNIYLTLKSVMFYFLCVVLIKFSFRQGMVVKSFLEERLYLHFYF